VVAAFFILSDLSLMFVSHSFVQQFLSYSEQWGDVFAAPNSGSAYRLGNCLTSVGSSGDIHLFATCVGFLCLFL